MAYTAQQLVDMGYYGYRGWGDAEANADFMATGGSGKGSATSTSSGSRSAEQIANDIIESQRKQVEEETKFLEQYTKDNPFVFDEELARLSATAEYEPYYSELLDDYIKNLDMNRATVQDEQKLLATMNKLDTAQASREYTRAVTQAGEGFAGQGMFFSGIKKRAEGETAVEYKAGEEGRSAQYQTKEAGLGRQLEGYNLSEEQKRRDVGREQQAAIESGILQRKSEATTQYETPLIQAYYRKFPSGSGASLQGYTVPDYLRY